MHYHMGAALRHTDDDEDKQVPNVPSVMEE